MALLRHRQSIGIVGKLQAAGLAGPAKPREISVIAAEIIAVEMILRRLRLEQFRAIRREQMRQMRADPEFEKKRRAGIAKASQTPEYKARRREIAQRCPQTKRLPPMTAEQYRLYHKLRWIGKQPREVALAEVLG